MKRNISPHVQIYSFPITAISSIATRLTGLSFTGLYIGSGLLAFNGINILDLYKDLNPNYQNIIKYTGLYSGVYHTLGGIRHFIWDKYPSLLTNSKVNKSSISLIGISFFGTYLMDKLIK
tara:strand:- start:1184 stop:1543 length:360 start_codon:yes stop_codon:yes gene_type:complete